MKQNRTGERRKVRIMKKSKDNKRKEKKRKVKKRKGKETKEKKKRRERCANSCYNTLMMAFTLR